MQQIDPQGLPATEGQETNQEKLGIDLGQQAFLFAVYRLADGTADKEKAKIGQQGEIIRGDKTLGINSQRHQPLAFGQEQSLSQKIVQI